MLQESLQKLPTGADEFAESVPDANDIRRLVQALVKAFTENALDRAKHSDDIARAVNSELKLHDALRSLEVLATCPALYSYAVDAGLLSVLAELIGHANIDVVAATLTFMEDLLDADAEADESYFASLAEAFNDSGLLGLLVSLLNERLSLGGSKGDDTDVMDTAALTIFSLFENAMDLKPELCVDFGARHGLVAHCVKGLHRISGYTDVHSQMIEVLAVMLQTNSECCELFCTEKGTEAILVKLSPYRHVAFTNLHRDEVEMVTNMFGILCAGMLMFSGNKLQFLDADGVQLMLLLVRKSKTLREQALKVLDFACTNCGPVCWRLFDAGGLGVIFACLMRLFASNNISQKTSGKGDVLRDSSESEAEHVLSIIYSLFRFADEEKKNRLVSKFLEHDGEKLRRLLALYLERLGYFRSKHNYEEEDEGESGLKFSMHLCCIILAHIAIRSSAEVRKALKSCLQSVGGLQLVCAHIRDHAEQMTSDIPSTAENAEKGVNEEESEKMRIAALASDLEKLIS